MKYCFVFSDVDKANYTGQPCIGLNMVRCAKERGHGVSIVSNYVDPQSIPQEVNAASKLLFQGVGAFSTYLFNIPRIMWFVRRQEIDCLIVHGALLSVFMRPFAALLGLPMIVSSCEVIDMHPRLLQRLIAWSFSGAVVGIVSARTIREQLEKLGVRKDHVHVARLGLRRDFQTMAKVADIDKSDIIFWGDSKKERGFDTVVRLAKLLPQLRFRVLLRWLDDECSVALDELRLLPNAEVLVYPYQFPLSAYVASANLVLLPFRFMWVRPPLSILEAMAMGKCVVTTAMAGNDELITHGLTGLMVDFDRDWDGAVAQIAAIMSNASHRQTIEFAAREFAHKVSENSCNAMNCF